MMILRPAFGTLRKELIGSFIFSSFKPFMLDLVGKKVITTMHNHD